MNRLELLALPPTIDIPAAAKVLGIGRTLAYQLVRAGEFPVPVLRLGARYRVVTSALLAALEVTPDLRADVPIPAPSGLRPVSGL